MEKEKSDPFVNLITMYQDKIEELESINDQLMQKYQILLEKYETDYKPQSAESHFAAAKYYFGFRWIERITKEYCELHNYNYISPDLPKEPKTYDEMMMKMGKTLSEMLKENYGTQKEKKRMEDNTIVQTYFRCSMMC